MKLKKLNLQCKISVACMAMVAFPLLFLVNTAQAGGQAGISYLWHMHQPIYWPEQVSPSNDRYEAAWQSMLAKSGGRNNPEDDLNDIFGKEDRRAAYQWRPKDSIEALLSYSNAGAQVNYSGSLMENVNSLAGNAFYDVGWQGSFQEANGWKTSGGKPRLDLVNFTFHHALAPLHTPRTIEMDIRLHRYAVEQNFGSGMISKGYFPTEMSFSERLIPILKDLGIEWSVVSNSHISRACSDFPLVIGTGGENCDPPNKADQINPGGNSWFRRTISRGCSPVNAVPFAYQPHYAQYVDPDSGVVDKIIVVPSAMALSWIDGYQCIGYNDMKDMVDLNTGNEPLFVLFTHDGDNAFGGGYSYYMECVPNFAEQATGAGHQMTTVQQYLSDNPPSSNDVVKVEDGGWVNADSDFGSPIFINWKYPPLSAEGQIDIPNGWHEKIREYAIWLATENRIRTAEAAANETPRIEKIYSPDGGATAVERAWHYYLGSLDSGYVYYGDALDHEVAATIGCNEAFEHADSVLAASPGVDEVGPSIWNPQRQPYNPGSLNFGVQYGWNEYYNNGDFYVWTFIYDVSGIANATLYYRVDVDGQNPLESIQNETFAGGVEVGAWQSVAMTGRIFPMDNVYNKGGLNYFELPAYIADHYYAQITGQREVLLDYYIEATDNKGHSAKSAIQHVWVGDGKDAGGGPDGSVSWTPEILVAGMAASIFYDNSGGPISEASQIKIHVGQNGWQKIVVPDPDMNWDVDLEKWRYDFTVPADAAVIDFVFNDGAGNWDNNNGKDWHAPVSAEPTPIPTVTPIPTSTPDGTPTPTTTPTPTPLPHIYWKPDPLVTDQIGKIYYDSQGGPISGAGQVYIHHGFNGWMDIVTPDPAMAWDSDLSRWRYDFTVPPDTTFVDFVFNDGAGNWDNNGEQDWHAPVIDMPPVVGWFLK